LKYGAGVIAAAAIAAAGYGIYESTLPSAPTTSSTTAPAMMSTTSGMSTPLKTSGFNWGDTPFEMEEEWYWTLNRAALAYATSVGDRIMSIDPHMSLENQTSDIGFMMQAGINGLMGCPIDPEGSVKVFEQVNSNGLPIVTYDGDADTPVIDMNVRCDGVRLGSQLGQAFVKKIQAAGVDLKGTVFMCYHGAANPIQTDRKNGMESVLKNYPDLKIVEYATESNQEKAKTAVYEAAQTTKPFAVMATNLTQLIGAVEGLQSANLAVPTGQSGHIWVAGVDAGSDVLKMIDSGLIDAAIDQPNLFYGALAVKFLRTIKLQGASALPQIGQTVISDNTKPEGPQSDGSYNVLLPDLTYRGVQPFHYPIFAPCPVVKNFGHAWLQVNAFLVDKTNADTAPIWANVAKAWFGAGAAG
jgi:ABC-type sugar transport system substrate-binding protein